MCDGKDRSSDLLILEKMAFRGEEEISLERVRVQIVDDCVIAL